MGALPHGPGAALPPRPSVRGPLASAPQIPHPASARSPSRRRCRRLRLPALSSGKGSPGSCTDLCPHGSLPPRPHPHQRTGGPGPSSASLFPVPLRRLPSSPLPRPEHHRPPGRNAFPSLAPAPRACRPRCSTAIPFLSQLRASAGGHHCGPPVPPGSAPRSSLGLPPPAAPPPSQAPSPSPRGFSHGPRVLQVTLPRDVIARLSSPPRRRALSSRGLIPFLLLRRRPLPALACPPPAPSPAAASPSARWAPGTGRSPPSWCRRASEPRPGAARDANGTSRGGSPRSRSGGAD